MRTVAKLTKYANEFLREHYEGVALTVPIEISGRMTRAYGMFYYRKKKDGTARPEVIRLAKRLIEQGSDEEIRDVLEHELIHYALCAQGYSMKQFSDGATAFESELKRLGVSRTGTKMQSVKNTYQHYRCTGCGQETFRRMKGYHKRYICGSCRSSFEHVGEIVK